jgi:hypothetical protein
MTVLAIAVAAAPATADEVYLRGGGHVTGVIVERTRDTVVLETAPGRVTLQMRRIERIVESRSALEVFHDRAAALAPRDVDGWAALARWAAERDLLTQAREAWQRVLAADPSHPEANAALARVQLDGTWMGEDEAYRARGYVPFDGRWVTPAEHEALVRERAADEASSLERRETERRVRDAEARAQEAEARAREAETTAQEGGIPYWWGWGGGGVGVLPPVSRPHHEPPPSEPVPHREPPPTTHPSSIGPTQPSDSPGASKPVVPRPQPHGSAGGVAPRQD